MLLDISEHIDAKEFDIIDAEKGIIVLEEFIDYEKAFDAVKYLVVHQNCRDTIDQ